MLKYNSNGKKKKNPLCEGDTDKGIHVERKQKISPNSMEEEREFFFSIVSKYVINSTPNQ